MSRLPLKAPESLTPQERSLHRDIVAARTGPEGAGFPVTDADGALLGPFNAMLLSPELGSRVQAVGDALRRSALTPRERELVVLCVAAHHRSGFEWRSHEQAAAKAGLDEQVREALRTGERPTGLSAQETAVHTLAMRLLRARAVTDAEYAEAVSALGERAVFDVTVLIGYYELMALVLSTFDVG